MAKDGARSGALRGRTRAAFEGHMRWAEGREGVGISGGGGQHDVQGRTRELGWQGRELGDEKLRERKK